MLMNKYYHFVKKAVQIVYYIGNTICILEKKKEAYSFDNES